MLDKQLQVLSRADRERGIEMLDYLAIFKLPVVSIDDLIKMKERTGRQQDKADIKYLKELKNEKK